VNSSDASSRRNFLKTGAAAAVAVAASSRAAQAVETEPRAGSGQRDGAGRQLPRIVVHPDGHFLTGADGTPFFWLGDTAWQLIQYSTRDECTYYLRTRARQGFSVIQTVVLAEFGGVKEPTAMGLLPFKDEDPRQPNEAFFNRVGEIVDEAAALGLYVALVPTWGDKLTAPWGRDRGCSETTTWKSRADMAAIWQARCAHAAMFCGFLGATGLRA
jgi:hypothetical protein